METVQVTNELIATLVTSSLHVLSHFSTDPALLALLANNREPDVREIAAANPATPDESKVLATLQRRSYRNSDRMPDA
jgi:hypothetical protein